MILDGVIDGNCCPDRVCYLQVGCNYCYQGELIALWKLCLLLLEWKLHVVLQMPGLQMHVKLAGRVISCWKSTVCGHERVLKRTVLTTG